MLFSYCLWSQGPYAHRVFVEELGASPSTLINSVPKDDFNGGHADPNLTYAKDLIKVPSHLPIHLILSPLHGIDVPCCGVQVMGVDIKGNPVTGQATEPPAFGAAADGDADRNMILGRRFFVTPSDSLAIIVAHADVIPFFRDQGGLKGVARYTHLLILLITES